jgi:hypothetical protein
MATRGTLYRCHLFSYAGPQTPGLGAVWTQNLAPIGDTAHKSGEIVELFVTLSGSELLLGVDIPIRFDVLEEDFILTGGSDDFVVSILGSASQPGDARFPKVERRITVTATMTSTDSPDQVIRRFIELHPTDYTDYLVIVTDDVQPDTAYIVTWWRADYVDDVVGKAEYYFIVNVGGDESQSEPVLNIEEKKSEATVIPSGFHDDIIVDDGDVLPPLPTPAVREASFLELAAQFVRGSGLLTTLNVGESVPNPQPIPGLNAPAGPAPRIPIQPQPEPDDIGTVIVSTINWEDPYGTGWPFRHNDDREFPERDHFESGSTPFDGNRLYILRDASWSTVDIAKGRGHFVCYDLTRAVRTGLAHYGTQGFAVLEVPLIGGMTPFPQPTHGQDEWTTAPHYLVIPLEQPLSFAHMRKETVRDTEGKAVAERAPIRYMNVFPKSLTPHNEFSYEDYAALRTIGTTDGILLGKTEGDPPITREFRRQLQEGGYFEAIDDKTRALLHDGALNPINEALKANDAAKAKELLLTKTSFAFQLATADERAKYLDFLLTQFGVWTNDELDAAITELFKAVENRAELISIRDRVGADAMGRLIRNHSGIWGLLSMLGKKLQKEFPPPPFLDFLLTLLQMNFTGTASKDPGKLAVGAGTRLILGPAGFAFSPNVLNEIRTAAVSLVKFAEGTVKGLIDLVTKPEQIVDAVGQLMNLIMTVELARMEVPAPFAGEPAWLTRARKEHDKAVKKLKDMADGALKSILAAYQAATVLSEGQKDDLRDELLTKIKWTILWEVLAMFIGVGEVKAAFNFARVGVEAASLALLAEKLTLGERGVEFCRLFSKALSRESRLFAAEEEAARAFSRLPKEDVQAAERQLAKADPTGAQTLEEIMAKDADAARALVKTRQETEAMALLIRKTGGRASDEIEFAFARLRRKGGLTEEDLRAVMDLLPETGGAQFVDAVNMLSEEAFASGLAKPEFFKDLAAHPRWAKAVADGDQKAFAAMYRHASGDAKKVDVMLDAFDDLGRELKHDKKAIQALVTDIENGESKALQKLADGPRPPEIVPPVKPKPPEVKPPEVKPAEVKPDVTPTEPAATPATGGEQPPAPPRAGMEKLPPDPPPGVNDHVYDLFNRNVKFYDEFDQPMRDAVDKMTDLQHGEHGLFRSLVTELDEKAFADRKAKLFKEMARQGRDAEIPTLEKALNKLNTEFTGRAAKQTEGLTAKAIGKRMTSLEKYKDAATVKKLEIQQRLNEYRRKAARAGAAAEDVERANANVKRLEKQLQELDAWLAPSNDAARAKELDDLAKAIEESPFLKDRLAHGGDNTLYRLWADMKFRPTGSKPVKSPFSKYVGRRMGEFRGLSGEMDAAFQLGNEFDLLKASDGFVTRRGIDVIAQRRIDRMLAILDNKSGFGKLIKDVSALTKNLVTNLLEDAGEFRLLAKQFPEASHDFIDAAERMERAANGMRTVLADVPAGQALGLKEQEALAAILKENNMQLLVTNFGGQSVEIAPALGQHIQFWDVAEVGAGPLKFGPLPPAPPP